MYHTIFAPLNRRQQRRIARLLALALLSLVFVTSTGDAAERLPVSVAVATSVRRICHRRCRSHPVAPPLCGSGALLQRTLPPVLGQTCVLLLLLLGGRAPTALFLLSSLPLLRWLLTFSTLVWPAWTQRPSCRWLRQTLADLHLALLLGLDGHLRGHILGFPQGGVLAAATTPIRPPKPTASGRILADGTDEVTLGDLVGTIRHKPVDEFDRRMFLLSLRAIHLVDRPSKWPFVIRHAPFVCGAAVVTAAA
ncbi:hypothetical protein [Candidatus Chloroploca sp. Khr17]|uniref:hypothetical protein n=1 Tax=Candidatus Chloroploca sp. Khr17 TaxID=2496869 RepID=UPI00101DE591|nr:hypothetical protein [Candidatus Chloroploca sp. Khr17]